jgi:hypothetical protein
MKKRLENRLHLRKQTLRALDIRPVRGGKGMDSRLCDRPSVDEEGCTGSGDDTEGGSHAYTCGNGTGCTSGCTR